VREISSLLNSEVISIKEGRRLGAITQVVVDLAQGKLLGLILGKGAAEKGVVAQDIQTLGPDVVMIETGALAKRLSELPDLMTARRDPTRAPQQVVTDTGQRLGRLGRVFIDSQTLAVTHFEVSGGAWRDLTEGVIALPVVKGIIHGPDTIIVPAAGLSEALEGPSLTAAVEKAAESMREGGKQLGKMVETSATALRKSLEQSATKTEAKPPAASEAPAKPASPARRKPGPKPPATRKPVSAAAKKKAATGRKPAAKKTTARKSAGKKTTSGKPE
jgi:uncharacterized protein YrrD